MADHGNLRHFASRPRRRRNGNDRQPLLRDGQLSMVVGQSFPVAFCHCRGKFRRVDGAAAADADHSICLCLSCQADGFDHAGELRVLLHPCKDCTDARIFFSQFFCSWLKMTAAYQHAALHPQLTQNSAKLADLPTAEEDLDRLGIDKLSHRLHPRSLQAGGQICAYFPHASPPDPGTIPLQGRFLPSQWQAPDRRSIRPCTGCWRY